MVDFHSHFLPGIDDGASDVDMSLSMLRESYRQGIRLMCATPHFYADEDDPQQFLERRQDAYYRLCEAMGEDEGFPRILLGAEILYFPGISVSEEIRALALQSSPFLLVEPPLMPWSDAMLDEIEQCGHTLHCIPVIAHIDRYIRILHDPTLFERVEDRRMLIQVNASFFLHRQSRDFALDCLDRKRFHFVGSDCHDMDGRAPNLGDAASVIEEAGLRDAYNAFHARIYSLLDR